MSFFKNFFETTQSQLEKLCEQRESYRQEKQRLLNQINESSSVLGEEQTALTNLAQKQQELTQKIQKYSRQLDILRRIFIVSEQVKDLEIDCGVDPLLHNALTAAIAPTTFDELRKENLANKLPRYQQIQTEIVGQYSKEYSLYQGKKIGQKSISYYATAFIAFGRPFYLKVCQRYHADCGGSDETMKFINSAWSIAQDYLEKQAIAKIA
ncbi:MAG: hypothetical protein QNJ41_07885 [Xenococcaceae cyanobacterium MO_188.B32]|nr:hypothetical protein [Xenococcaceae cyanobacterium MO_188.B32]